MMSYHAITIQILLLAKWSRECYSEYSYPNRTDFVELLRCYDHIECDEVARAMVRVDSRLYNPKRDHNIGPYHPMNMQAFALENLKEYLKEGSKVLDAGCGSGYLGVCLAYMVGKTGHVYSVPNVTERMKYAHDNVKKYNPEVLDKKRLTFIESNVTLGYPEEAPYDVINVGAPQKELPAALLDQLKKGGRLMIPIIGDKGYNIVVYDKKVNGAVTNRAIYLVQYKMLSHYNYDVF